MHLDIPAALGLPLACLTGLFYAVAETWESSVRSKGSCNEKDKVRNKWVVHIGSFLLFGSGGLIITLAYASKVSVPLVNAAMMATNMFAVMILQMLLGIKWYNLSMRHGTSVFCVAVVQLAYISPGPREEVNLERAFSTIPAIVWLSVLLAMAIVCSIGIFLTRGYPLDSERKIMSWACLISCLACLTDNGASAMGDLHGQPLLAATGIYLLMSILVLVLSTKAPAVCDISSYVPLQLCWQLINNMITGFVVWDDAARLHHTAPYLLSFLLCIMSVQIARPGWAAATQRVYKTALQRQFYRIHAPHRNALIKSWKDIEAACPGRDEAAEQNAREAFAASMKAIVNRDDGMMVADLCVRLYEARGTFALCEPMWNWIQDLPVFQKLHRIDADLFQDLTKAGSKTNRAELVGQIIADVEKAVDYVPGVPGAG